MWADDQAGLRIVSLLDSALDREAMAESWNEYLRSRNPELVKQRPGMKLTWFHLRWIPTDVFTQYVDAVDNVAERSRRAFLVGVERIEGWRFFDDGPIETKGGTARYRGSVSELPVWSEAEVNAFPPRYIREIGEVSYLRSFLGRGTEVSYPPPQWLLYAVAAIRRPPAASIHTDAGATDIEAPPPATPAQSDGSPSDAPTDATATVSQIESSAAR